MQPLPTRSSHPAPHGFTLLETVLAVSIAIGMMLVVLYFYQQTSTARSALLQETEKIAAVRRIMDRLTSELRGAVRDDYLQVGLIGGPDYIQILTTRLPPFQPWNLGREEAQDAFYPQSDLVEVGYVMSAIRQDTNSTPGLMRWQEPFLESVALLDEENLAQSGAVSETNSIIATVTASAAQEEDAPPPETGEETRGVRSLEEFPVLPQIQHVRFRYYDGLSWWDFWEFTDLPLGVEISLGAEPMPEDQEVPDLFSDDDLFTEEEFSYFQDNLWDEEPEAPEVFRRLVYLPGSTASFQASDTDPLLDDPFLDDPFLDNLLP